MEGKEVVKRATILVTAPVWLPIVIIGVSILCAIADDGSSEECWS